MRAVLIVVAACSSTPTPATTGPIDNASSAPVKVGLPCGAENRYELSPYGPPRCEPDGSCYPGPVLPRVGSCAVAPSPSYDRFAGNKRSMVFEGNLPILSSDATPNARIVLFDPRVPSPHGIRVGMTGADLERMFPGQELRCELDEIAWRGHLLCKVRMNHECDAEDANWHLVIFDADGASATMLDPRLHIRARRIEAIDLGPGCGED